MKLSSPLSVFLAPNLCWILCFSGPIFSQKTPFDESYTSKEHQIWIRYQEGKKEGPFVGVWSGQTEQKPIQGYRQGEVFFLQSDKRIWNAILKKRGTKCRVTLELTQPTKGLYSIPREKRISLVASYC